MAYSREQNLGVLYALLAFGIWGIAPLYFRWVGVASPPEVVAHRVLWSIPVCVLLIFLTGTKDALFAALKNRRVLGTLMLTAVLISLNWLTFIYAIMTHRVLEASLGYYLNPLINVLMGMVFLGERLRRLQLLAVGLAALGTLNQALFVGGLPWIALVLAFSFATYGILRKTVPIDSVCGLLIETALLSPLAFLVLGYLFLENKLVFGCGGVDMTIGLALAGVVTCVPLLLFTKGARRLTFTTLGLCQYVAPTGQFLLAVLVFGEIFTTSTFITFGFIWAALSVFMYDSYIYGRTLAPLPEETD